MQNPTMLLDQKDISKIFNTQMMTEMIKLDELNKKITVLEEKCISLAKDLDFSLNEIKIKDMEIAHLKKLLEANTPSIGQVLLNPLSDEELIAEVQLGKIREAAKVRDLTLDEIKKFDLLVKNKRLAQGNPTIIEAQKSKVKNLDQRSILQIASQKINKE